MRSPDKEGVLTMKNPKTMKKIIDGLYNADDFPQIDSKENFLEFTPTNSYLDAKKEHGIVFDWEDSMQTVYILSVKNNGVNIKLPKIACAFIAESIFDEWSTVVTSVKVINVDEYNIYRIEQGYATAEVLLTGFNNDGKRNFGIGPKETGIGPEIMSYFNFDIGSSGSIGQERPQKL